MLSIEIKKIRLSIYSRARSGGLVAITMVSQVLKRRFESRDSLRNAFPTDLLFNSKILPKILSKIKTKPVSHQVW